MAETTIYYFLIITGLLYGIAIGWLYFNTYRWVNIKRLTMKKNYGIAFFRTKGRAMFPVVKNFDRDVIRTMKGIWILNKGSVYRQVDEEKPDKFTKESSGEVIDVPIQSRADMQSSAPINIETIKAPVPKGRFGIFQKQKFKEVKAIHHHTIRPDEIDFRQGVPVVYFDLDSMLPLRFADDPESEMSKNPYQVESTLGKEVAAAELEAIKMTKRNMMMLMYAIIILGFVTIIVSAMSYLNTQNILGFLQYINQTLVQPQQVVPVTPPPQTVVI